MASILPFNRKAGSVFDDRITEIMGEAFARVPVDELVGRAIAGLEPRPEILAELHADVRGLALEVPPRAAPSPVAAAPIELVLPDGHPAEVFEALAK